MSKLSVMFNCPDYGPAQGHYYADEDTGEYRPFCSCGHTDPYAPREDDYWPRTYKFDPNDPENEPPF